MSLSFDQRVIKSIKENQPATSAFLAKEFDQTTRRMTRILRKLTEKGHIRQVPYLRDMRISLYYEGDHYN